MLARRLDAAGERVVDDPPTFTASGCACSSRGSIDKTDPNDARSAAIVAWRTPALNVVTPANE